MSATANGFTFIKFTSEVLTEVQSCYPRNVQQEKGPEIENQDKAEFSFSRQAKAMSVQNYHRRLSDPLHPSKLDRIP